MDCRVINEIKQIEEKLDLLCKKTERRSDNNDSTLEKIDLDFEQKIKEIDNYYQQCKAKISANNAIINRLHSMIEMLPSADRIKYGAKKVVMPNRIDINYISNLFVNIRTDTFVSFLKRTFRIDGYYKYSEMVRDFLMLCAETEKYLLKQNEDIKSIATAEIEQKQSAAKKSRNFKIKEQQDYVKQETEREKAEQNAFLTSPLIAGFDSRLKNEINDSGVDKDDWDSYDPRRAKKIEVPIGYISIPFCSGASSLREKVKKDLMHGMSKYVKEGNFYIPYLISTRDPLKLLVKYLSNNEKVASEQIQLILLRMLRNSPADTYNIHFVDPENKGENIGILNSSAEENAKISIFAHNTKDEIRRLFKDLEKEIDDIGRQIGSYKSVYDYNLANNNAIKENILVLFDFPKSVSIEDISIFELLVKNAKRCGLHIIIATEQRALSNIKHLYKNLPEDIDWSFANDFTWCNIDIGAFGNKSNVGLVSLPRDDKIIYPTSIKKGDVFTGIITNIKEVTARDKFVKVNINSPIEASAHSDSVYFLRKVQDLKTGDYVKVEAIDNPKSCVNLDLIEKVKDFDQNSGIYIFNSESLSQYHRDFIKKYREKCVGGVKTDNTFSNFFNINEKIIYKNATNGLRLPIMANIGKQGGVSDLVMGTTNSVHTMITGSTGSGKSTFLHAIISSILMNYHPNDVELWLVDYGVVEFNFYYSNLPPHVKFISLENSEEFTYSFLTYVEGLFKKRSELFKKEGVESIQEYRKRHGHLSMSRIVLMIDEFHNMAQHVQKNPEYKIKLENLLTECRKLGLSCIFSDQTISSGMLGLTERSKEQIKNRLAMINSIYEMKNTLGLAQENYTSELVLRMERSETGEIWYKDSETLVPVKYKGIYISKAERLEIIEKVRKNHQDLAHSSNVVKINSTERQVFPKKQFKTLPVNDDSVTLYLGTPVTIEDRFAIELERRYNQNMLLAGRNIELKRDVLLNVLRSIAMRDDSEAIIIADSYDPLYKVLKNSDFEKNMKCKMTICTDVQRICYEINRLESDVRERKKSENEKFVIWLGMGDLFAEFAVSPAKKDENPMFEESTERIVVTDEAVDEAIKTAEKDPDLIKQAEKEGRSVREMILAMFSNTEKVEETVSLSDDMIYNATKDVLNLFAKSSRFGIYNVVVVDNSRELTSRRDIKLENFGHMVLLNMPRNDFGDFGIRSDEINVDDNSAMYHNGIVKKKFRPYI